MSIQPIDVPALARAVIWPLLAAIAFVIFRRPLNELASLLGHRVHKLSVAGVSLELSEATAAQEPKDLDTEIRQLDAGLIPQSGVPGLTSLLSRLQHGRPQDFIVIDLGSEAQPRWLTSRLYILALLITLVDHRQPLVFVESVGNVRRRFVGLAYTSNVRWSLARAYPWLEAAAAGAYGTTVGGLQCVPPGVLQIVPGAVVQFDPATGFLPDYQLSQLLQQFLALIRVPQPAPGVAIPDAGEWVTLGDQWYEHAKWLDGARIERVLGADLDTSYVTLLPNASLNSLAEPVLAQRQGLVAVLDPDKSFRGLVDRSILLEKLAAEFSKQALSPRT